MTNFLDTLSQFGAFPWPASSFIGPAGPVTTSASPGIGTLRLAPQYIPNTVRLAGIVTETTVAGDAGSLIRVGVYASASNGNPTGAPLATAVTAADTATFATGAVNVVLQPGFYWIGACFEGATQPTIRNCGQGMYAFPISTLAALNGGLSITGVTPGTLPTLTGATLAAASNVYHFTYQTGVV